MVIRNSVRYLMNRLMFGSECIYHEENCIIDHVTKRATDVNRIEKKSVLKLILSSIEFMVTQCQVVIIYSILLWKNINRGKRLIMKENLIDVVVYSGKLMCLIIRCQTSVVSRYPQRAEGRLEASPQDRNPCKSWQLRWMSHADARARISLVPPPLYPECPALRPHSLSQRVPPPPAPSLPWGPPGGSASLWRVTWNAWCAESPTTVLGPPSCLAVSTPSVPYA